MLVGKGVRELVDQRGALFHSRAGAFQYEQLLLVVVVESGGLFGKKIHGVLAQIEIGGDKAEHLEGQLFGAQVGWLDSFFDALIKEGPELVFVEDSVGDGAGEAEAGDAGEASFDSADLGEERRGISSVEERDGQQNEERDA
ncbi:MAG: hypothetical protein ABSE86_37165 [Bryobacteraceae bacterium]